MSVLTFDFETLTHNKGNPFDSRNKVVCMGYKWSHKQEARTLFFNNEAHILAAQQLFEQAKFLIGFNVKFDLHWARKLGLDLDNKRIFDCQIAEFLLTNQSVPYPSLNDCSKKYLNEEKVDEVASLWDAGIQTDDIAHDTLAKYVEQDVLLTEKLGRIFQEKLKEQGKLKLFLMQMEDLLVLEEMEWNGLKYDAKESRKLEQESLEQIKEIDKNVFSSHPYGDLINPASGDWLSAFLYGGIIKHEVSLPNGTWKTGARAGQPKYKHITHELKFERQFEPPKKSELKKEGFYATDEKTLRKIKGGKKIVEALLLRAELEKLHGTYYKGLPDLIEKMSWPKDTIHGQLNQVVARTGRLSSSNPNIQNFSGDIKQLFYTRYSLNGSL